MQSFSIPALPDIRSPTRRRGTAQAPEIPAADSILSLIHILAQNFVIAEAVREQTRRILDSGEIDNRGADAFTLSIDLKMDRANVSRILNGLWKDGSLIKFQGKPTLFLDRKLVSEHFPGFFIPQTVARGESLSRLIRSHSEEEPAGSANSLEQLIGADASMKDAIVLAKASVSYPPFGLHTLLHGSIGVGKNKFAHCMYLYKKSTAPADASVPFVSVGCHNFSENPKLFSQQFLGLARDVLNNKSRRGFLDTAKGGILFFDEVEYLPPASLDLIASVITRGSYNRIGETAGRQLQCMILASTTRPDVYKRQAQGHAVAGIADHIGAVGHVDVGL